MGRRRDNEIELDFDGLADSLTDLVGTLTLFVFLLFVLSHEIRPPTTAPNVARPVWEDVGKSKSTADLLRELTQLSLELAAIDGAAKREEGQLGPLRERVEALSQRASNPPQASNAPRGAAKGDSL